MFFKKLRRFIYFLLFFWITVSLALLLFSNHLIFRNQNSQGPIKSTFKYDEVFITYDKDKKLYLAQSLEKKEDPLIVLFFHGNAGKAGRIINDLAPYHNVVSPAYPGYHLSNGKPNEESVYRTVDLSMDYLKKQGIKEENIIIFGASLGGAAALYSATKYPNVKKVIIVGTFDKIQSVCSNLYHIFCIFAGSIFNNIDLAKESKASIRQFHSINDEVIDFEMGDNLFKYISSKDKKFYKITGSHDGFDAAEIIEQSLRD